MFKVIILPMAVWPMVTLLGGSAGANFGEVVIVRGLECFLGANQVSRFRVRGLYNIRY